MGINNMKKILGQKIKILDQIEISFWFNPYSKVKGSLSVCTVVSH